MAAVSSAAGAWLVACTVRVRSRGGTCGRLAVVGRGGGAGRLRDCVRWSGAYVANPVTIFTIAGAKGTECSPPACGDGGPATSAGLRFPEGVAADRAGNVLIADTDDDVVRRVDPTAGTITTIAGTEQADCSDQAPRLLGDLPRMLRRDVD